MLCVLRIGKVGLVESTHFQIENKDHCVYYTSEVCHTTECICVTPQERPISVVHNHLNKTFYRGKVCSIAALPKGTLLHKCTTENDTKRSGKLLRVDTVYANDEESMEWLDTLYRNYICNRHIFKKRSVAIQSVAGSGKTTTLISLAKRYKASVQDTPTFKKILYIAFNKQLVQDIKQKLYKNGIHDVLVPVTFDALVKRVAEKKFTTDGRAFELVGSLTPQTLTQQYEWFKGKSFTMKKCIINDFATFCQDAQCTHPKQLFPSKKMVHRLWEDTLNGTFLTFDGLRKRAYLEHWMKSELDSKYARVFVDEAQDFDPIMLDILKHDCTIPKVFVGDPKQQIYEWRGTINAFEHLPENTLLLEFYKTFRMGLPATHDIAKTTNTRMISGSPEQHSTLRTQVTQDTMPGDQPYTYLFRSWKGLLTTAQKVFLPSTKVWIYDYDKQMHNIETLHEKLTKYSSDKVGKVGKVGHQEEDDLPAFLMKLTPEELQTMKEHIETVRVCNSKDADVKLYTIHSFKGMEDDIVRVAGDIHPLNEPNLYYVALTRGRKHIYADVMDDTLVRKCTSEPTPKKPKTTKEPVQLNPAQHTVYEKLKSYRLAWSQEHHKPAFCLFTNALMEQIALVTPTNTQELLQIKGIGKQKTTDYGDCILKICCV